MPAEPVGNVAPVPTTIKDLKVIETTMGRKTFELHAKTAYMDSSKRTIQGMPIVLVSFGRSGEPVSRMTANEGWMGMDSNDMQAKGRVRVKSASGSILETDRLDWSQEKQKIKTDAPVKVIQRDNVMTGVGMESDAGLDHVMMYQVDAVVSDPNALQAEQKTFDELQGPANHESKK